jgi:hypothetical protein
MKSDYELYQAALFDFMFALDGADKLKAWAEIEAIKNRHGGMPPKPPTP